MAAHSASTSGLFTQRRVDLSNVPPLAVDRVRQVVRAGLHDDLRVRVLAFHHSQHLKALRASDMYRVKRHRLRRKVGAAQDRLPRKWGGSCLIPALKIILPFAFNDRRALFNNILIFRMDAQRSPRRAIRVIHSIRFASLTISTPALTPAAPMPAREILKEGILNCLHRSPAGPSAHKYSTPDECRHCRMPLG